MTDLTKVSTKELHEELAKRKGVIDISIGADNGVFMRDENGEIGRFPGPARVIVNID